MCYILPLSALKKIKECNPQKPKQFNRKKRIIGDIIAIGIGSAALTLSTVNTVQIANLKSEVKMMSQSLQTLQKIQEANKVGIVHLQEGQMKIAQELQGTQDALNRTIRLLNMHTDTIRMHDKAIRDMETITLHIKSKLDTFIYAVEGHFLHSSMENILNNKLNIDFVHAEDIPKLFETVIQKTNIVLEDSSSSLSMIDLMTKLLVHQQIDFIPTKNPQTNSQIGSLIITSFFAACDEQQDNFYIYEAVSVPFKHGNKRVKLAQMPALIGLHPQTQEFVRWSAEEATSCNFEVMTSCRETPATRKDLEDTCIYQIITDQELSSCHIEQYLESTFIKKVSNYWVISTNSSTKCHAIKVVEHDQHQLLDNHEIVLPPTAIYSNPESSSLTCDKFHLPGLPKLMGTNVMLYHNQTMDPIKQELINLQEFIDTNTNWTKAPYIPSHIKSIIDFMINTTKPPEILFLGYFSHTSMFSTTTILAGITILLLTHQVYSCRSKQKYGKNITVQMPSWKRLEKSQEAATEF